ncbi:hypothetical protein HKL94_01775 [Candidatus Parcubacteria bacterium]|nr:hypothetical protein [Candidatus Parcubacteria bacterium]
MSSLAYTIVVNLFPVWRKIRIEQLSALVASALCFLTYRLLRSKNGAATTIMLPNCDVNALSFLASVFIAPRRGNL